MEHMNNTSNPENAANEANAGNTNKESDMELADSKALAEQIKNHEKWYQQLNREWAQVIVSAVQLKEVLSSREFRAGKERRTIPDEFDVDNWASYCS